MGELKIWRKFLQRCISIVSTIRERCSLVGDIEFISVYLHYLLLSHDFDPLPLLIASQYCSRHTLSMMWPTVFVFCLYLTAIDSLPFSCFQSGPLCITLFLHDTVFVFCLIPHSYIVRFPPDMRSCATFMWHFHVCIKGPDIK